MLVQVGVLGLLGALVMLAQWSLVTDVIHAVFLEQAGLTRVLGPLALIGATIILRVILTFAREAVAQRSAVRIKAELRERLLNRSFFPGSSLNAPSGELVTTMLEGPERMEAYYARFLPQAVLTGIVPVVVLAGVLRLDLLSGVILALTGPLIVLFMWLVGLMAQAKANRQWLELRRLSAHLLDVLQGLGTLKLFNRTDFQRQQIAVISDRHRATTMEVLRVAFLSGFVLELLATLSTALVAVTVGVRLLEGQIGFHAALLVLLLTPEFYAPFRQLGLEHHAGMEGRAAAGRVFEVLDSAPALASEQPRLPALADPPTLEYREVGVMYPGQTTPTLENVSLRLKPGTVTAVIGPSGAGKTTLARLLLRLLEPSSGTILCNGQPMNGLHPNDWQQQIAWVPQHPHLFAGTVLDNLLLARPNATLAEVWDALELAGAAGFVERLPRGLETRIGERGARLSGGERQRIAIARAFLKNAPILVLDEATSHLDLDGDVQITEALQRLAQHRTTLLISHRRSTILRADQAVLLEAGRIVKHGSPQHVLAGLEQPVRPSREIIREEVLA